MKFKTYYKNKENLFRCYNGKKFKTEDFRNFKKYNYFECFDRSDDAIKQYHKDIQKYSGQIKDNTYIKFNYLDYKTDIDAIITFFRKLGKQIEKKIKPINETEIKYIENCHNGFFMYMDKNQLNKKVNIQTYDFNNYFGTLMGIGNFRIPKDQGCEIKYDKLPEKLKVGFYKVKIKTDKDVYFSFTNKEYYTHLDIKMARKLNLNIKLNLESEYNAYVYDDDKTMKAKEIFNNWFKCISFLKKKFPKNKLVKTLSCRLWGSLSQKNYKWITEKEFLETDELYSVDDIRYKGNDTIYKIYKKKIPYKTKLGRLKSFLIAYSRFIIAEFIRKDEKKDIFRIYADSISLYSGRTHRIFRYKINEEYKFKKEEKNTGKFKFKNINRKEKL